MLYFELIDPSQQIADPDFHIVRSFLKATGRTQIGWHYITDLTWLYSRIKHWPKSLRILDAGGGTGPLQFLLAEMGFSITNIDMALKQPPPWLTDRYQTTLKQLTASDTSEYLDFLNGKQRYHKNSGLQRIVRKAKKRVRENCLSTFFYHFRHNRWQRRYGSASPQVGNIQWVTGNLCHLNGIPSNAFDAVVSLSALEHIPLEQLGNALNEIRRVLKTPNYWAITTSATDQNTTWYHQPSRGYCYSISDLKIRFKATSSYPQNPKRIRQEYQNCDYLKRNLAKFYSKSSQYGMPWGKWDPKYIPVGINTEAVNNYNTSDQL